jgi:hypothetical protein
MTPKLDVKGRPIRPGDLVKSWHYRDRRWGHQWLYHVVCDVGGVLYELWPVEKLNPSSKVDGGRAWLTDDLAKTCEIVQGGGEYPDNFFQERKK